MLIPEEVQVHLYCGITDMRKSINTLAILVKEVFGMELESGRLFLFRSRCGSKLKALYYEECSFTLWYRRLEKGKFIFPRNTQGHIELTKDHLNWLIASNKYTFHQGEEPVIYRDFHWKKPRQSGWLWYNVVMQNTHDHSIFSSEFQAIFAPLQDENQVLKQEAQEWKEKYHHLLEQLRLAKQQRFGRSSEAHIGQGELHFDEADSVETTELPQEESTVTVTYTQKKPVRRPLPEHLPREVIEHDIPAEDKLCACGCMKQRIGEEVTEQLEYIPAKLSVIAHVRPKYACNRCDEAVSIAPMPSLFLPKSMATPSLVAHAIVSKYEDHLPLYRQEQMWARLGIELPRNTVCGWIMAAAEVCMPMRDALMQELIASNYLQADETTVQVMDEPNRNTSTSYMWVYTNHQPDKKVVLFDYQQTRQAQWPKKILKDFKGYLQTDGYKGYDWVDDHPDIIHLGCFAHARRPFAKLVKIAKTTGKSRQAVAYIKKLYLIEQQARNNHYSHQQRYELRLQQAKPILDELKSWLDKTIKTTAPQSELGKALDYMHVRWDELTAYLLDGCLEIDNNLVENLIRPFALGRKNWMMSGSPRGAHASALFYSLIATAKANELNPFNYLKTLFENIRSCKTAEDYKALLPFNLNRIN